MGRVLDIPQEGRGDPACFSRVLGVGRRPLTTELLTLYHEVRLGGRGVFIQSCMANALAPPSLGPSLGRGGAGSCVGDTREAPSAEGAPTPAPHLQSPRCGWRAPRARQCLRIQVVQSWKRPGSHPGRSGRCGSIVPESAPCRWLCCLGPGPPRGHECLWDPSEWMCLQPTRWALASPLHRLGTLRPGT